MSVEGTSFGSTKTVDEVTLTDTANVFSIKSLGVDTAQLAASAVTLAKTNFLKVLSEASESLERAPYRKVAIAAAPTALISHTEGKILVCYKAVNAALDYFKEITVVAGTWSAVTSDASQRPLGKNYTNDTGHAINDAFSFPVYFPVAGTYTLKALIYTSTNRAIISFQIDDTEVATQDGYSAAGIPNVAVTKSLGSVTAGLHTLKLKAASKNGSSNGYIIAPSEILIEEA